MRRVAKMSSARWTCPTCSRRFVRNVITVREGEMTPDVRPEGHDSRCPKCGHLERVLPEAAGEVVLKVTHAVAD